jgi:hypothetical protein
LGYNASQRERRLLDMGQLTRLIELVPKLESLDQEATIYAAEPWNRDSPAIVAVESSSGRPPEAASRHGLRYFIEVFVARDFLADWESGLDKSPTDQERCDRLIEFAIHDA